MEDLKKEHKRGRANSLPTIADFLKRKREHKEELGEGEEKGFQKSKKTLRSPQKREEVEVNEEMDKIIKKLELLDEIQKELQEIRRENKEAREEFEREKKRWEEERSVMKSAIRGLEEKLNYLENQSRRDNIVIKGLREEDKETWEDSAVKVIEVGKKIGVEISKNDVLRAHRIGGNGCQRPLVAKLRTWKIKEEFMKNKAKLRGTDIIVHEDMSKRTIEERKHLLEELKRRRERNEFARLTFDKLLVDEGILKWDIVERKLINIVGKGKKGTISQGQEGNF